MPSFSIGAVQIDPDALPNDAAALQQMLRTLLLQHGELHAENDKLRLLIKRLLRHQFGRRSEQLSPDQLQLGLEDLEQTIAANQTRRGPRLPVLRPGARADWRDPHGAARHRAGAAAGAGDSAPALRLPGLRRGRGDRPGPGSARRLAGRLRTDQGTRAGPLLPWNWQQSRSELDLRTTAMAA